MLAIATGRLARNRGLVLGNQDCPVNQKRSIGEAISGRVVDAEPVLVLGGSMLAWWRQEFLDASRSRFGLAAVMRIVEVHVGPGLQMM